MRQRKPKNLDDRLTALSHLLADEPLSRAGRWRALFSERAGGLENAEGRSLFLEIGTGKGGFLTEMARAAPDSLFLGVEGRDGVMLRALEKAEAAGLRNILFSRLCLSRPGDMFAEGELDGIFLNFSDPWPKDRHAVRRLTHRGFLAQYLAILRPGACVEFRTDDTGFFRFSLLEFEASGFSLLDATEDLGGTLLPARAFASEYERRFVLLNRRICYLRAAREGGGAAAP